MIEVQSKIPKISQGFAVNCLIYGYLVDTWVVATISIAKRSDDVLKSTVLKPLCMP